MRGRGWGKVVSWGWSGASDARGRDSGKVRSEIVIEKMSLYNKMGGNSTFGPALRRIFSK